MSSSFLSPNDSNRFDAEEPIKGNALKKIITAMNKEAIGSNTLVWKIVVSIVDATTPADPSVSANMCKNIPFMFSFSPASSP